jgi:outer membrane protein assembly factor BamB
MGASSPAVRGDTVVVAYSSGELFGLRSQNGRVVWSEVLAVPMQQGAVPAIADIRGLPVIETGRVFAISHSGRMISIDERTGERAWEADIGGTNTPCVGGNAVFVVTNDNELVALTRDAGRGIWRPALQKLAKPSDRDSQP